MPRQTRHRAGVRPEFNTARGSAGRWPIEGAGWDVGRGGWRVGEEAAGREWGRVASGAGRREQSKTAWRNKSRNSALMALPAQMQHCYPAVKQVPPSKQFWVTEKIYLCAVHTVDVYALVTSITHNYRQ